MENTPAEKKKNLRTVRISHLEKKGRGVGKTDTGGQLTVPYTIPGELIEVEKLKRKEGRVVKVTEPSPHRIHPLCKHFTVCGGCAWQHIDYEHQLTIKKKSIADLISHHSIPIDIVNIDIVPSPPYEYRNRMDYVWWFDGRFGLRQRGKWHSIVNLEECHLLPQPVMKIVFEVNRRVQNAGLPFRDQKKKIPGLRYLIIRRGVFTGEVMLLFVTDPMELPHSLWKELEGINSVYQLINDNLENDNSDGRPVHVAGEIFLRENICGKTFKYGPRSFFQPNPVMAEKMVEHIRALLLQEDYSKKGLLDLYCGVGLFSALLVDHFREVKGIECSEEAVNAAKENAKNLPATFLCEDAIKISQEHFTDTDVLIADPPRVGIHPKTLQSIKNHPFRRIIYVSCNPRRGLEDIEKLSEQYDIQSIRLFDQFPQTPHVEMIADMKRKDSFSPPT